MRTVIRLRDLVSFAVFVVIVVFVLSYFRGLGIQIRPPDERINLSMDVPDISGLVVGSNVLLRGVPVGKISGTNTNLQEATIDFYIDARYPIPVDSEVRLENLSALGESYVGLVPRSDVGPTFHDGQHISTEAVTQSPPISELATSVGRVLGQMNPDALKRVIAESDTALPDPAVVLPNLSRASVLLRNTAADMNGAGREVIGNIQALLTNGEWVNPALSQLTPQLLQIGEAVQDLFKGAGLLMTRGEPDNVTNVNRLVGRVQGFLDVSGPDLKILGEAFQPKLNAIAASLMNFDTGQLLDNMLAAIPPDGTITLRVVP